jgi:hypothetical protein
LHRRELRLELREDSRQDVNAGGLVSGDHQFSARIDLQLRDVVLRPPPQIQHLLGILGEDAPGRGQGNAAPEPLEKVGPQFLFQLPHLCADGRLRPVTRLRRFGEALQLDDFEESAKLVEIHKTPFPRGLPGRLSRQFANRWDRNNQFPHTGRVW